MSHILVVQLDDSQNGSVHEHFVKGLPVGASIIFDFPNPWNKDDGPTLEPVWFDRNSSSWNPPHLDEYNWLFLRQQQNWANDMLRARGHVFLNDVYSTLGLPRTQAGAILGWVYTKGNEGDNFIDFGCWDQQQNEVETVDEKLDAGAIKLIFNVNGPILQLLNPQETT